MSRITKDIATQVAIKLLESKKKEVEECSLKLSETLESFVLKKVPKKLLEYYKEFPQYTKTKNGFQLHGNGFNFNYISVRKDIPSISSTFDPTPEEAKILLDLKNKKENLQNNYEDLKQKIEIALYSLRTYAKVAVEFPEAVPFLPKSITDKVALNIIDIRKQIKI